MRRIIVEAIGPVKHTRGAHPLSTTGEGKDLNPVPGRKRNGWPRFARDDRIIDHNRNPVRVGAKLANQSRDVPRAFQLEGLPVNR